MRKRRVGVGTEVEGSCRCRGNVESASSGQVEPGDGAGDRRRRSPDLHIVVDGERLGRADLDFVGGGRVGIHHQGPVEGGAGIGKIEDARRGNRIGRTEPESAGERGIGGGEGQRAFVDGGGAAVVVGGDGAEAGEGLGARSEFGHCAGAGNGIHPCVGAKAVEGQRSIVGHAAGAADRAVVAGRAVAQLQRGAGGDGGRARVGVGIGEGVRAAHRRG